MTITKGAKARPRTFYMTDDQWARVTAHARALDLTVSQLVRRRLTDLPPPTEPKDVT